MSATSHDVSLATEYCDLHFPNPFVLASGPPTARGVMIRRAFAQGWGGAVTKTITLTGGGQSEISPQFATLKNSYGETIGLQHFEQGSSQTLEAWLQDIKQIKEEFPERILIASIAAKPCQQEWQELAQALALAGADALELNLSAGDMVPTPELTEQVTAWVKAVVKVPVIVKLAPEVTDVVSLGKAALAGGAEGLAAISNFKCLLGVNLEDFQPFNSIADYSSLGRLSGVGVQPIGLRVVAQLGTQVPLPVSGMGGITSWEQAVEYMLLGAKTVQICTQVMLKGYDIITHLITGLENYLRQKEFTSVQDLTGRSLSRLTTLRSLKTDPTLTVQFKREWCVSCGECIKVCQAAGTDALGFGPDKSLQIDSQKCNGCALCVHVCRRRAIDLKAYQLQKVVDL